MNAILMVFLLMGPPVSYGKTGDVGCVGSFGSLFLKFSNSW